MKSPEIYHLLLRLGCILFPSVEVSILRNYKFYLLLALCPTLELANKPPNQYFNFRVCIGIAFDIEFLSINWLIYATVPIPKRTLHRYLKDRSRRKRDGKIVYPD